MNRVFKYYTDKISFKSQVDNARKRYYVKGYVTTSDLDLVNDIVTHECMKDIEKQFSERIIKLDFDHESLEETDDKPIGSLTKMPLGKAISHGKDEVGNFIEWELNPNWKNVNSKGEIINTFSELWDSVEQGFYDSFSIAYYPISTVHARVGEGKTARLLNRINLINVALTGNPINPGARMAGAMAKSLNYMLNKEEVKMTEEKSEVESLKEQIKSLTEEVNGLKKKADMMTDKEKEEMEKEKEKEKADKEKEDEEEENKKKTKKSFEDITAKLSSIEAENKELKSIVEKANVKSAGAEQKSAGTEVKSKGPLDWL